MSAHRLAADPDLPATLSQAVELALAGCRRDEPMVPAVVAAVIDFLSGITDEIEGCELKIPGTRVWLHTTGQVSAWLDRQDPS